MIPSFLDGLSPHVTSEVPEAARDAPSPADKSFETYLQRPPAPADRQSDDNADAANDETTLQAGQTDQDETDRQGPQDVHDEGSAAAHAETTSDPPSDDEPEPDAILVLSTSEAADTVAAAPTDVGRAAEQGAEEAAAADQGDLAEATSTEPAAAILTAGPDSEATEAASNSKGTARSEGGPVAELDAVESPADARQPDPNIAQARVQPAVNSAANLTEQESLRAQQPQVDETAGAGGDLQLTDEKSARKQPEPVNVPAASAASSAAGVRAAVAAEAAAIEGATKREATGEVSAAEAESGSPPPATAAKSDAVMTSPQDRFAQQLMAGSTERGSRSPAAGDVSQARLVDRVARAFRATDPQGGTLKLRLHPPELGILQVQLKVQGNALTAKLEAETPAARALLVDSLPILRERLAEQGIRIEQFDIDLMERHPQGQPDGTGDRPTGEREPEGTAPLKSTDRETSPDESQPGLAGDNQQLNIIV